MAKSRRGLIFINLGCVLICGSVAINSFVHGLAWYLGTLHAVGCIANACIARNNWRRWKQGKNPSAKPVLAPLYELPDMDKYDRFIKKLGEEVCAANKFMMVDVTYEPSGLVTLKLQCLHSQCVNIIVTTTLLNAAEDPEALAVGTVDFAKTKCDAHPPYHPWGVLTTQHVLSDTEVDAWLNAPSVISHPAYMPSFGSSIPHDLATIFPSLNEPTSCPVCGQAGPLNYVIIHLNDQHAMKREQIADWLDGTDLDLSMQATAKGN